MASGLEIFLIIFILIIVIVGISVGIYFIWRQHNKTEPTPGPTETNGSQTGTNGGGQTGGPTGTNGGGQTGGQTGTNGNNQLPSTFSIQSVSSPQTYFYVEQQTLFSGLPPFNETFGYEFKISSNNSSNNQCKGFTFRQGSFGNIKDGLIWDLNAPQTSTNNIPLLLGAGSANSGSQVNAGDPSPGSSRGRNWQYDWTYDFSNKTWCLTNSPNLCINANGEENRVRINTLPNPITPSFQWNIVPPLTSPCSSN